MLNKWRRWFHSSRVKFPLVKMSACWFLVSMYLIWFLGSKLIPSNNQSRATLWVLETCLIVGLLPLIIILIMASLSSNTYNRALDRKFFIWRHTVNVKQIRTVVRGWSFDLILRALTSRVVLLDWFWEQWNTYITKFQRSRAGIPSIRKPVSRETISASVELCGTEVCFSHIQLIGTNVWLSKTHNVPPEVDFESSRSLQNRSLETVPICIVWQYYPHDNIVCIHTYDEYLKSIDSGVCHKPWSILWLIVQADLLTIKYQAFQYVPSTSISVQFGSILVAILQHISLLL